MKEKLKEDIKNLPNMPGIYKMYDKEGKIIYIGKAKSLKKRVRQYFQKNYQHSTRTKKLLENLEKIETISVDTELEAIILERNLIKQYYPKYNIILKDDKNFVYIKITNEDFPKIQLVRNIEKDNAKYIGPKTAAHKVKDTLKILKKIFPFRHCNLEINFIDEKGKNEKEKCKVEVRRKTIKYPCLDYYIKRCAAPCIANCSKEEYQNIITNVTKFLEGKAGEVIGDLKKEMVEAANLKQFEKAALVRDKIAKIESILEKQKISDPNQEDKDIINYIIIGGKAYFNLFQVRDGILTGQENFTLTAADIEKDKDKEVLEGFLTQYYELTADIPKEILLPHEIENEKNLLELINLQTGKKPKLIYPQIGTKNKLIQMCLNNAKIYADRSTPNWKIESDKSENSLYKLQEELELKQPPKRIECYDISHLAGTMTVGSMIVFKNGVPDKSMYRKFQLRTIDNKPDDFRSMEEVLIRRFTKISEKNSEKEYKFRKISLKTIKSVEKLKIKLSDERTAYLLTKDDKILSVISISEISKKTAIIKIEHLLNNDKNIGILATKKALEKIKSRRIYAEIDENIDIYKIMGFEELKNPPNDLDENNTYIARNNIKKKDDKSFNETPDLIVIDGGKGQLQVAVKILKDQKLEIPVISLAKRLEEIFTPKSKQPIILEKNNPALNLLQRTRDEAHRFAITYNKLKRNKKLGI